MPTPAPDAPYPFLAEEGPLLPGSPYTPPHPAARRVGYALLGLWIAATGSLANAAITVNLANLAGEHDAWVAELSWLPAVFVAFNASANLMLVRSRAQWGVARIMRVLFLAYAGAIVVQALAPGFASALAVRAASGVTAAGMNTLGIYYLMQSLPAKARPVGLVVALGVGQLATPLARLLPVDLLAEQGWRGEIAIELALVASWLALTTLLPLPPTDKTPGQFSPLDGVTIALFLPAMVLLCGVLNRGRLAWWTDTPWLGWALAAAIPLLAAALAIETLRENPLVHLRWIGSGTVLRFVVVALMMRLALAEQTYGAVGLLTAGGLDDDQLRVLFACVAGAMLLGTAVAAATMAPPAIPYQVIAAALVVALGAWLDTRANNLTRPAQLVLSQSLIGFGTSLFIGPSLAYGFLHMLRTGPAYLVTLVVVFSITQNVGGLAGSAALGSYQTVAARAHAAQLGERLAVGDPLVAARVRAGGGAALGASIAREANVLAFVDVFRAVAALAVATAALVGMFRIAAWLRSPPPPRTPA